MAFQVSAHQLVQFDAVKTAPAPSKRRKAKTASVPVQQASQRARTAASTQKSVVKAKVTAAETEMVGEATQGAGEVPEKATIADTSDREALRSRALTLREQGLSYGKIAAETGVPVSTVKRWAA
ncbi:helix-turn-helix domain-containing protein [Jonesia quinghaiensis]|uniref:helix-turn-helix domain-containing protein n=1 Tax=Jonesia quinghaiensis TaxID=262806 RepID=UPI0003F8E3B5|nr:helix-turn-helix domain-containing protein [Jonesia quinghaiensis]